VYFTVNKKSALCVGTRLFTLPCPSLSESIWHSPRRQWIYQTDQTRIWNHFRDSAVISSSTKTSGSRDADSGYHWWVASLDKDLDDKSYKGSVISRLRSYLRRRTLSLPNKLPSRQYRSVALKATSRSIQHGCRWQISVWSTAFANLNHTVTLSLTKLSTSSENICSLEIMIQSSRQ